jgi:hypothetical protein
VSNPLLHADDAACKRSPPGRTWTGVVHRPIDIRQLSKTPLAASARVQADPSDHLARAVFRASGQNKKAF